MQGQSSLQCCSAFCPAKTSLGTAWAPHQKVVLGASAGRWRRHIFHNIDRHLRGHTRLSWRLCAKTSALLEITLLLLQRLQDKKRTPQNANKPRAWNGHRG